MRISSALESTVRQSDQHALIDALLKDEAAAGKAAASGHIYHGFSRGSANSYAVAVLDGADDQRWMTRYIANSGAWSSSNVPPPPVKDVLDAGSTTALSNTEFYIYYGLQDHDPSQNGETAQKNAAKIVQQLGGSVKLVENPEGCHSTFLNGGMSDFAFDALLWAVAP